MTDEPQVIPPEDAKAILYQAITDELGAGWDTASGRWVVVTNTAYMARLNKGQINMDFYVDYFSGEVTVQVREVHGGQDTGRLLAWMLVGLFTVIVVMLARALGYI